MKKAEKILKNIEADKELQTQLAKVSFYSTENFISDVKAYIRAIKNGSMVCTIPHVSKSGMSRNMKFNSCNKTKTGYYYRQYYSLFKALGYRFKGDAFVVNGCGMDMVFHTNYSNMHLFKRLGFISKAECETLAQKTPTVL